MTDTRVATDPGLSLSSAALEEWNGHVDALLRGIAHALNNRAAALSAAIQLGRDPHDAAGVVSAILEPELSRVTELVAAIRAIGAPKRGAEAFSPRDAAVEATAILALHAEQRERGTQIDVVAASPLRTQRWMFVRALIALGATGAGPRLTVRDDGDDVVVLAEGATRSSAYARELAAAMGGESLAGASVGFRVPTLAAIRLREGR